MQMSNGRFFRVHTLMSRLLPVIIKKNELIFRSLPPAGLTAWPGLFTVPFLLNAEILKTKVNSFLKAPLYLMFALV